MKPGIMTYCLKNALPESDRSMDKMIKIAGEEGYDLEVYSPDLWREGKNIQKLANSARKTADKNNVKLFSFGTGARVGEVKPDRSLKNIKELKDAIDVAEILGAEVICPAAIDYQPVAADQTDPAFGMVFDRALPYIIDQMQELADYASDKNISIALVNHCYLVYLGIHQYWIAELSERPNAGACIDPGNYVYYTYGSEDPVRETVMVAEYAKLVRAGDWVVPSDSETLEKFKSAPKGQGSLFNCSGTIFGQGDVDHESCFKIIAETGYDGYVSLKVAGSSEEGPMEAVRTSMKNLTTMLEGI
ncbi:TIM barrel protein [Candidatus Poribacteria bacterium]|nr:TIM barrel protein [Candidatus Poribacteria bacterium]